MTRFFVSLAPFNPPEVSKKIGVCSWYMICSKSQLSHSHISQHQHQHQLHVHIEQFSQFVFFLHDWNGLVYYSRQVPKWFTKPCRRVFIGTTTGTRSHHQPSPLPRAPPLSPSGYQTHSDLPRAAQALYKSWPCQTPRFVERKDLSFLSNFGIWSSYYGL